MVKFETIFVENLILNYMEEVILNLLSGLPSAACVMYVWIETNKAHVLEREVWRREITDLTKAFNLINNQIQKLDFIIETYVIEKRNTPTGE